MTPVMVVRLDLVTVAAVMPSVSAVVAVAAVKLDATRADAEAGGVVALAVVISIAVMLGEGGFYRRPISQNHNQSCRRQGKLPPAYHGFHLVPLRRPIQR